MATALRDQIATAEHDVLVAVLNWLEDNVAGRLNSREIVAALEGAFADILVPALADEYRMGMRCGVCGRHNDDRCTNEC